jgi:Sulfotransferase family
MLISRSRRFMFVHIQKTGGSTIAELLARHVPDLEQAGAKHGFLAEGRALPGGGDGWFKFGFVRNPWDRLVSWHSMIDQARAIPWHETWFDERKRRHYRQMRKNPLWRQALEQGADFDAFVRNCDVPVMVERGARYSFAFNQVDYLADAVGNLAVDFVGRFEHWERDADAVFRRLGIEVGPWPRHNPSRHRHYSTYYTPETADLVRRRFARDIAAFGYEFAEEAHG